MRAFELYEEKRTDIYSTKKIIVEYFDDLEAYWINVNSGKIVRINEGMSHTFDVILYPEKYGFTKDELIKYPQINGELKQLLIYDKISFENVPDLSEQFDSDPSILEFMTKHGWVRVVVSEEEINVSAFNIKHAAKATKIIVKKYPDINVVQVDIMSGENYNGDRLSGKRLELFMKNGTFPSKSIIEDRQLSDPITQQELDALESKLDKMYSILGLDVEFTKHFLDRLNDPRNKKQITIEELFKIFQETLKVHGKKIAQFGPDFEAIMNDISTSLNIPFVLQWNNDKNELEIVSKTIMRKDNFMSSSPKLMVGLTSKKKY